jgi:hypothetical protein
MERLTKLIARNYPVIASFAPFITLVAAVGLVVYGLALITRRLTQTTRLVILRTTQPGSTHETLQGKSTSITRWGYGKASARPRLTPGIPVRRS